MYEIYFAAMSNGVSIVVKCGHHQNHKFIENKEVLKTSVKKVDIHKTFVTFGERKYLSKKLEAMPTGFSDIDKMNSKLRGVLRAAAATTCGDPLLHNAACGDEAAKEVVLQRPEQYIHQIAIAGYNQLLKAALEGSPDLLDAIDTDTGRSLLTNAAFGGSLKCVSYIAEMEACRDVKDKDGKTALSYAIEFGYSDCVKYLSKEVPPSFYIKHIYSQRFVVPDKDKTIETLVLQVLDNTREFVQLPVKENKLLFRFVQSGMFVHSDHHGGRMESGASILCLSKERSSSCYPFDYDSQRCLLTGGDNFFVKSDSSNRLVWHKYKETYDENNPFISENGFEFEIIFHPPLETYTKVSTMS